VALALIEMTQMRGEFSDANILIYRLSQNDAKQDKTFTLLAEKPISQVYAICGC